MIPVFGYNVSTDLPKAGQLRQPQDGWVWWNNETNVQSYVFVDGNVGASTVLSIYSGRSINVTYACESHEVTASGNGSFDNPTVADIGSVFVSQSLPYSTTFFHNENSTCPDDNPRCSVIEVLETSETQPWYYKCNITVSPTQNDPQNLSFVSDQMALYASASIAQGGFIGSFPDDSGVLQDAQIFPQSSIFGSPAKGDNNQMGLSIAYFSIGSLAIAGSYNPSKYYQGTSPTQGQQLTVGHAITFLGILFLLLLFQAIFIIIVAIWANKVKVAEDSPLGMAVLMRPVADKLDDISHGRETKAFKKAKKSTKVQYEKDPVSGMWCFRIKTQ